MLIADGKNEGAGPVHPNDSLYLLMIAAIEGGTKHHGCRTVYGCLGVKQATIEDLIDPVAVLMELVEAELVADPKQEDDGAGETDGQTGDINDREAFVTGKIPPGGLEIIGEEI